EARRNLDPGRRNAEQADFLRRTMAEPLADPMTRYRAEAEQREADREAERTKRTAERRQAETAAATTASDWSNWVHDQIRGERAFMVEVCGGALGELTEELRAEFAAALGEFTRVRDHARLVSEKQAEMFHKRLQLIQEHYKRDAERVDRQLAVLERQVDLLAT